MAQPSPQLNNRILKLLGVADASYQQMIGGYTPAARWTVTTPNGRFFAKVGTTPLTNRLLREEAAVYTAVQAPFMPKFIGWEDAETEPLMIIEDLSEAFWPPPWNRQRVDAVLQQLDAMHHTPASLPTYSEKHGNFLGNNWQSIADDPAPFLSLGFATESWLKASLPTLIASEQAFQIEGNAFSHWDIRSDNLCFVGDTVKFIDWPGAALSNPLIDVGFWLPSLAFEGGPKPQEILPSEPELAACVSGYFASRAGRPPIPNAPGVRVVQQQQLSGALPWVIHALKLSAGKYVLLDEEKASSDAP